MRSIRGGSAGWQKLKAKQKPVTTIHSCYQKRKERLSGLGYTGYQAYLESDEWKEIRGRKLRRYPNCLLCQKTATQVHHLDYNFETLLGLKNYRLVQLCGDCHKEIEFDEERKRDNREANRILFKRAEQTERGRRWIEWGKHQKDKLKHAKKNR